MTLTLRMQEDGPHAGQTAERRLECGRIVLGRGAESDWVLTDPERTISKRHCIIEQRDPGYEITDLSTNGVFLNDDEEPIGIGNTRTLRHGDRIRIGPYTLSVELAREAASAAAVPPDFPGFPGLTVGPGVPGEVEYITPMTRPPDLDLDRGPPIDAFFAPQRAHPETATDAAGVATPSPSAAPVSAFSPIPETWAEALQPVRQPAAGAPLPVGTVGTAERPAHMGPLIVIPTDWDAPGEQTGAPHAKAVEPAPSTRAETPPAPTVAPVPPAPVAAAAWASATGESASAAELVAAFCAGAGLDPSVLAGLSPAETVRRAGELLRIAVEGLMAVLASRRSLKNEFRLSATEFRPVENNPLKFSVDADQAMQMLMGRPQRGFLPATEAFRQAVDDLRMHELAMLAGMQEAWLIQLQRFNPRDLSDRLEADSGLVNLLGLKKARCWDAFVTLYDSIAGNADNEWERTFQNIFGAAYERSMQKQRKRSG